MYSSHRIASVTCLRRSSRCIAAQSGSACRRWPRRVPSLAPALANSRASSSVSVRSSDNGQASPAASNRRIVNRTVDGAVPIRRAISRVGIPADFNLITSRTWRIASLSVGILVPFAKPKGGTVSEPEEAASPRAASSRNAGRDHLGMVGDIKSERWARSFRNGGRHRAESALGTRMLGNPLRPNWTKLQSKLFRDLVKALRLRLRTFLDLIVNILIIRLLTNGMLMAKDDRKPADLLPVLPSFRVPAHLA